MDEETLRELIDIRSRQERQEEALQLLQQQPQIIGRESILQQLNQGLGLSAAGMLSRARSPIEAPAPAPALDQMLALRRRSSLVSASTQPSIYAHPLSRSATNALSGMGTDLSSLAINQEIKRLEELQQQLASTRASASTPFSYSSQSPVLPPRSATDPNATILQHYLLQKAQLGGSGQSSGALGGWSSNPNLAAFINEAPDQSILESQLLEEARLLRRPQENPPSTFAAAAGAKAPAPFPTVPPVPSHVDGSRKMRGGVIEPFPEKLHRLLLEVEITGRTDIISFVSEGRAFAIHKSDAFFRDIVPLYFKQSRLSSFKRQLNLYGFELINSGPNRGAYYHSLFQREKPQLCRRMRRVAVKVSAAKASAKSDKEAAGADSSSSEDEADRKVASTLREKEKTPGGSDET